MSDEPSKNLYYHDPFHDDQQPINGTGFLFSSDDNNSSMYEHKPPSIATSSAHNNPQVFDPSYMSFTDCLQGSMDYNTLATAFNLSPSSSEVFSPVEGNQKPAVHMASSGEITPSPNSSVSSSSTEAGAEEDSGKNKKDGQGKEGEDGGESSKKVNKTKKKGEKSQKEPRFAFMTKSEVDHLEDGYRWRKYGQKAVKNSPYPRSYYRCTTQKCTVKKRVERSFQDPSIVITTYEGQHNHQIPTTLRGNASQMLPHSILAPTPMMVPPNFPQELLIQMSPMDYRGGATSYMYQPPQTLTSLHHHDQQLQQLPDYGLLQDMVPSLMMKQEP
ncbi:hypothetical protein L1049_009839 [Liquidambar formosana]|uniref:WRKY domain-containing protein n=1 Tax=Liquidambar formosana TaxID=63359 RepID=A0AAP0N7D5_LIQFO